MRQRSPLEVRQLKVADLGFDSQKVEFTSVEVIAAALRRAATLLCPCSAGTLVRAVVEPLRGLVDERDAIKTLVEETLEATVSHGDLVEFREFGLDPSQQQTLLFAAPQAFASRKSGAQILVGVADDRSVLPDGLAKRLVYAGHTRRLYPTEGENLRERLIEHGFLEIPYDEWLTAPRFDRPAALVSTYDRLLDAAGPSGDVPGLRLLDSERGVDYYPGRWVEPRNRSGRYVARRDQAYGAQLWCYVRVRHGEAEALIDLPLARSRWRGCDEAWHLQMALDAVRGKPQTFSIDTDTEDTRIIAFFSPVPMWARRRWSAIGELIAQTRGLFAYRIPKEELSQERDFLQNELWLNEGS